MFELIYRKCHLSLLLRLSIAFLWIWTALVSLWLAPEKQTFGLLQQAAVVPWLQTWFIYGASSLNLVLGLATLANYKLQWVGLIQCLLILSYTIMATYLLPALWLDPLGSLSKNVPLIVATVLMVQLEAKI